MVPNYIRRVHRATRESTLLSSKFGVPQPQRRFRIAVCGEESYETAPAVTGTCISGSTGNEVRTLVCEVYLQYMEDILRGKSDVLLKIAHLSRRYKKMWKLILQFLHDCYVLSTGQRDDGGTNPFDDKYRPSEETVVQWKTTYIKSRENLLRALGIVRIEFGDDVAYSSTKPREKGSEEKAAMKISSILQKDLVIKNERGRGALASRAAEFAVRMAALLGVEDRELERALTVCSNPSSTGVDDSNIAQMILLGFPLSLYSTYFIDHLPGLIRAGVHCMPQPNSVVFSKLGVSKSTALRYVLGKYVDIGSAPHDAVAGVVKCNKAISLGDNPQSTDFELTVFPDVLFISIEKTNQREERHQRIHRRLTRTEERERRGIPNLLPDGRPAPSLAALKSTLRTSGPMMDDRLCGNILYVGGEEGGTGVFLDLLMTRMGVPQDSAFCDRSGVKPVTCDFHQMVRDTYPLAHKKVSLHSQL